MIKYDKKIELLAPAKDKECAFAAINAGADAVYLGADAFGARKKAGNSLEDIKEIVDYAHKFLVKIYVTVNTLIYDGEIKAVEKLVWDLYKIKVDAIIFQDFSFFEMNLPPVALHASTQCNNDSLEKIEFLKKCNVSRVVLPREFSLKQIEEVTEKVEIETEVFVHGALCVSYSGQCYFSNHIGKRSANRGDCAQPCRKKYSLVDEKGKIILKPQYLLSMKDFSLSSHIEALVGAGVTSLKIEGRLKDVDYVKNVVSFYRKKIDEISSDLRQSIGIIKTDFESNPDKTFNRGYTNFYFDEKRKSFINPRTPKFVGEKIGEIKSIKGNRIQIDSKIKLNVADKVTFFDKKGDLNGTTITIADRDGYEVLNSKILDYGATLYRNFDSTFNKQLQASESIRKIPLKAAVNNKQVVLTSFDSVSITYEFDEPFETAQNLVKAKENVAKQFSKFGDTEFFAAEIEVSEDFNLFIPVSKLNEIRRNAVLKLQNEREKAYQLEKREIQFNAGAYPQKMLDYSFNVSNKMAKEFYQKAGCEVKELAPECGKCDSTVTLMKTKHCLRDYAGICLKKIPQKELLPLFLIDEYGVKYKLNFDCKNCIMKIEEP